MIDEGILSKESRLIALYGINAQASPFLSILNATFKGLGLNDFAIGLNIKPEDFAYMVKGMPNSKVTMALYEPEFQEEVVGLIDSGNSCIRRSGLCDGARAQEGKLVGHCFYPSAFERMVACEGVSLQGKRVLLLGAGALSKALLSLMGVLGVRTVAVAGESVEEAAKALEEAQMALATVKSDVLWFRRGMSVDVEAFDVVVNAADIHAHSGIRLIDAQGQNGDLVLIDFVRGESAFDPLAKILGCRKIGGDAFMRATALSVASEWLGADVECADYEGGGDV